MTFRTLIFSLLFLPMSISFAADYNDWRKTGSNTTKQKNLIRALPGTSTHMLQIAERYRTLYWAGMLGKWEFAEYQLEEIEEIMKQVGITRPKRKATADAFLTTAFSLFPDAIKEKDQHQFIRAFKHLRAQCLICHAQNDHAFITLPSTPSMSNSLVFESPN